jgi:hypothetical protein
MIIKYKKFQYLNEKQNLTDNDIQKIMNIVLTSGNNGRLRAQKVIELFPDSFSKFNNQFQYKEYCKDPDADKYQFLPLFANYIVNGSQHQRNAFREIIFNTNKNIIAIVKELKNCSPE